MIWEGCGRGVVHLRFDFYGAFFTGGYGCLSSVHLFAEMIKQS